MTENVTENLQELLTVVKSVEQQLFPHLQVLVDKFSKFDS